MHTYSFPPFKIQRYLIVLLIAFLLRALTFTLYIQHNQRYRQPDTLDYHFCALSLYAKNDMCRLDDGKPIFWRTPGYPFFLTLFYKWFGVTNYTLESAEKPIKAALWTQIIIDSCIPLIILLLAWIITHSAFIALIAAWIVALCPGFILISTYLLSEAVALVFFFLFLLTFYLLIQKKQGSSWLLMAIAAGFLLGITTWIRPMGQFLAVATALFLLLFDCTALRIRLKKIILFLLIFFITISPWYLRNHTLTGQWFFCPMFGVYLTTFNAPKIVRRIKKMPLNDCIKLLYKYSEEDIRHAREKIIGTNKIVSQEAAMGTVARAILLAHPFYAFYDWTKEVLKTTFDLYSYQIVALVHNSYKYDPIEEFLTEKWQDSLYHKSLHPLVRALVWLEVLYTIILWLGIFLGFYSFIAKPMGHKGLPALTANPNRLWLVTLLFALAIVGMTGGFGYARLRLPAEPLFIIIALWGWCTVYKKRHMKDYSE